MLPPVRGSYAEFFSVVSESRLSEIDNIAHNLQIPILIVKHPGHFYYSSLSSVGKSIGASPFLASTRGSKDAGDKILEGK